jgi:hypothetical protein
MGIKLFVQKAAEKKELSRSARIKKLIANRRTIVLTLLSLLGLLFMKTILIILLTLFGMFKLYNARFQKTSTIKINKTTKVMVRRARPGDLIRA